MEEKGKGKREGMGGRMGVGGAGTQRGGWAYIKGQFANGSELQKERCNY